MLFTTLVPYFLQDSSFNFRSRYSCPPLCPSVIQINMLSSSQIRPCLNYDAQILRYSVYVNFRQWWCGVILLFACPHFHIKLNKIWKFAVLVELVRYDCETVLRTQNDNNFWFLWLSHFLNGILSSIWYVTVLGNYFLLRQAFDKISANSPIYNYHTIYCSPGDLYEMNDFIYDSVLLFPRIIILSVWYFLSFH